VRAIAVIALRIVMAQQIQSIVAAIRRSHDRMDVEAFGLLVRQEDAAVMIELDHGHGALNAKIERADVVHGADPGKVRLREVLLYLVHACI
jgi:hypothetical protein